MGNHVASFKVAPSTMYTGTLCNGQPHGHGSIIFSDSTHNWIVKGQFYHGQLKYAQAESSNLIYNGQTVNGVITGEGEAMEKAAQVKYRGNFKGGILIKGQYIKQKEWYCVGSYVTSNKQRQNEQQILEKEKIKLNGDNGQFVWEAKQERVKGNFINGELDGLGSYFFSNSDYYEGSFKNGYLQGFGMYFSQSSTILSISGYFHKSKLHSLNQQQIQKIKFVNGDIFIGTTRKGAMHGNLNQYRFSNGVVYRGSIFNNQLSGQCQIMYPKSSAIQSYKGDILEGKYNGMGVIEYKNGLIMKGYFLNGLKNGPCVLIYGLRMWKCTYMMDQIIGEPQQLKRKQ